MWSKAYLGTLVLAVAKMAFFSYYSWSWLQSIGMPAAAAAGYEYHSRLASVTLPIATVVLLMLANGVFWETERAWAIWSSFTFFATFIVIRYFWLDRSFIDYSNQNGLTDRRYSFAPILAVVLLAIGGIVAFTNQFLLIRLRQRAYQSTPISAENSDESENAPGP
ncbi:MAG: hypothetical protein ABR530_05685 [Pyrinomonadaceae bacterium]